MPVRSCGSPTACLTRWAWRRSPTAPGVIQTPVHAADGYDGFGSRLPPLGRVGQVSDVVDGVLFLESSPYITGEILHIDGDPNSHTASR